MLWLLLGAAGSLGGLGGCVGKSSEEDIAAIDAEIAAVAKKSEKPKLEPLQEVTLPQAFPYDSRGKKDPFAAAAAPVSRGGLLPDVPIEKLGFLGTIGAGEEKMGMVKAPDGKVYTLSPGMRVGASGALVLRVEKGAIVVQERTADQFGRVRTRERQIAGTGGR